MLYVGCLVFWIYNSCMFDISRHYGVTLSQLTWNRSFISLILQNFTERHFPWFFDDRDSTKWQLSLAVLNLLSMLPILFTQWLIIFFNLFTKCGNFLFSPYFDCYHPIKVLFFIILSVGTLRFRDILGSLSICTVLWSHEIISLKLVHTGISLELLINNDLISIYDFLLIKFWTFQ